MTIRKELTAPTSDPVRLVDLESQHCRYIVGADDDMLALFCGAQKDYGSYCEYHAAKCYNYEARRR